MRQYLNAFLCVSLCWFVCGQGTAADEKASDEAKKPPRIVALAPHIVELLFDIGAGEQIIATTTFADYPEAAKRIPVVGNYARLQIEKIIALQPDIVIVWEKGNPVDDIARLQELGFTLHYTNPIQLADIATELRVLGQLTGHESQAEKRAAAFERKLSEIRQRYAHLTPISVFYELWSKPLRTIAGNAWPQQHLTLCGASNVFASALTDYPEVSMERVLTHSPQIIVQPHSAAGQTQDTINWLHWPMLPAVQHQQVFTPDADKLHRMSTRTLDEVLNLCEQIDRARKVYANKGR